jgi:hypothetical protein
MYGCGDEQEPLPESIALLEELAYEFIADVVYIFV